MRRTGWPLTLVCMALAPALAGCGSSNKEPAKSENAKATKKVPKRDMTPGPAGKSLAAADDGRIVVTMPEGWLASSPAKATEGLVALMRADARFPYPTIYVRVAPVKDFNTITSSNLDEFFDARRETLQEGLQKKSKSGAILKLYGDVQPVKVKSFRGIEYLKLGKTSAAKSASLELAYIETVVDGRMYTIELHSLKPDLEKYRPAALAVAANLKFPKAKIEPEEEADAEE
jgi:hypothetical protein